MVKARLRVGDRSYEVRVDAAWKARLRIGSLYLEVWRSSGEDILVVEVRGVVDPETAATLTPPLLELLKTVRGRLNISVEGVKLIVRG